MANHNQVAHAWANQTGKHRKGFNMYYEGDTIYSYGPHFPIARKIPQGFLVTTRSYSVSTAKHKSYTLRAISGDYWHVENVRANSKAEHLANYKAMIESAKANIAAARKAKAHGDLHLVSAISDVNHASDYAKVFKLGIRKPVTTESLGLTDAEYQAIKAKADAWHDRRRDRQMAGNRKRARKAHEGIRKWLKHESNTCPHTSRVYVRVSLDRTKIETSWGASVPFADGKDLWDTMKNKRASGGTWTGSYKIGDFTLERITPAYAKIGCHVIPYRFACLAAKMAGIE